jgi:hypothetical protein
LRTGDIDVSREVAFDTLKNVWGVTGVGGSERWLKYAPEVMYPLFGGDSDEVQKQLIEDMAATGIGVNPDEIRLVADFRTSREVNPETGRRQPTYAVGVLNEFGEYEPLRDKKTGELKRWRPDFSLSQLAIDNARERFERLERSKSVRDTLATPGGGEAMLNRFNFQAQTPPGPR